MATAQLACLASAKLCAIRVSRLGPDCAPVAGVNNAVVTSAVVKLIGTPQYDAGQEYTLKNGCGNTVVELREVDKLKSMNLDVELALRDMELIELMTGAQLYLNADTPTPHVIGMSRRGVGAAAPASVSVEIWTRAISLTGDCTPGVSAVPQWWRIIYPKATFTLDTATFENSVGVITLKGFASANPQWGNGPFNDYPAATLLDPTTPEAYILDASGLPVTQCGYISVPVQT